MNIVDTITYDVELTSKNEYSFNLYKTDRPVYSKEVFDFISSKMTRMLYPNLKSLGLLP